ncbi:MAG: CPBP family intramembrane metalloprotease [Planctomycetota bacterium]|nr:CPBP family intramembrane metalloprotease [Planctomycetota bacterium]
MDDNSFDEALPEGYFRQSQLPLHALVFVLPLMILFEIGTQFHPSDPIAFRLLQLFFHQLGANGRFIPALSLVGILLSWHIARKDRWNVRLETLSTMIVESVALSLPLLALGLAVSRWHIHVPLSSQAGAWRDDTILSLGAGIYEELMFRLILMTALMVLLADILRLERSWASLLMVVISAVLFSMYHYLGHEPFQLQSFVFRTLAGIYFAVLFLTRGFGITAGCHISYDILIVALQAWAVR